MDCLPFPVLFYDGQSDGIDTARSIALADGTRVNQLGSRLHQTLDLLRRPEGVQIMLDFVQLRISGNLALRLVEAGLSPDRHDLHMLALVVDTFHEGPLEDGKVPISRIAGQPLPDTPTALGAMTAQAIVHIEFLAKHQIIIRMGGLGGEEERCRDAKMKPVHDRLLVSSREGHRQRAKETFSAVGSALGVIFLGHWRRLTLGRG